jgi:hypothetical protein
MGFSLRRMFRHPFGKHSVFAKATQVASILPLPGMGLLSAASRLANRGDRAVQQLRGVFGIVAGSPVGRPAATAMPGGTAPVAGSPSVHLAHKRKRKASRGRSVRRKKGKRRSRR